MKAIILSAFMISLAITSCKKNYGCECTDNTSSIRFAIRDTKKSAKKKCSETEYHETGTCTLLE